MADQTPRVGARFEHARQLDPTWRPGPGQRYADAPHVVMVITRITRGSIYYRPEGTTGAGFVTAPSSLPKAVGRWLED